MSLNVKSKIELDTSSSVAHLQNLVANFKTFGAVLFFHIVAFLVLLN